MLFCINNNIYYNNNRYGTVLKTGTGFVFETSSSSITSFSWLVGHLKFWKKQGNGLERNTCQKKLLEQECTSTLFEGFIGVPERIKTT